jgi:hypothetical protein
MRTPYRSPEQFREKAALLASELMLDKQQALEALAHISGYASPSDIGHSESDLLSSREELMARLQAIYPEIANDQAAAVIDKLDLPLRETNMEQFSRIPGAAPNISG